MDLSNNLFIDYDSSLDSLKIKIISDKKFIILIENEYEDSTLYVILYSYIKNKNIQIKSIVAVLEKTLGKEYVNLINIVNFKFFDFILFKGELLYNDEEYHNSNFLFSTAEINNTLQIEVTTFNPHNLTENTKPLIL